MSWGARPTNWGIPGHINKGNEFEAVLDRLELLSSPPRTVKSLDQDVTSSTTVVDDNDLSLSLLANTDYDILGLLIAEGNTAGDLKIQWSFTTSTGTELNMGGIGPDSPVTSFNGDGIFLHRADITTSPSGTYTIGTNTGAWINYLVTGNISVGSSNLTMRLQWAQGTSSGTATRVKARSWLRGIPLYV